MKKEEKIKNRLDNNKRSNNNKNKMEKNKRNNNKDNIENNKKNNKNKREKPFRCTIIGERVISSSNQALNLYNQSRFGEIIEKRVYYSLVEALHLMDRGKASVFMKRKKMNHDSFLKFASEKEPNFFARYSVFNDLRIRGYIIKTALKFGADFRVYERGVKPGEEHAKWIVFSVYESAGTTWHEFAAKNRVAHSTRKKLLIAIVDDEGDVTYYEVAWTRP